MNERFQAIVYGAILALIVGWVLHIGKDVLVPIAFGILVVYLIVGLTRLLCRVPILGRVLPVQIRNAVSVLVISSGLVGVLHLLIANTDDVMAHAQFGEPGSVLALLAALTVAQFVIGNFLDPYLMGSSLNLSPFAILLSKTGLS